MRMNNLLAAALFTTAAVVACQSSFAQVVPFKARGDNAIYSPATGDTSGAGVATHMGKVFGSGIASPTGPTGNPGEFYWTASNYSLTTANGDKINLDGGGTVQLIPLGGDMFGAVWKGQFNVLGGTGRFANVGPATEPVNVIAENYPFDIVNDPLWTYSWTLTGDINLGKKP